MARPPSIGFFPGHGNHDAAAAAAAGGGFGFNAVSRGYAPPSYQPVVGREYASSSFAAPVGVRGDYPSFAAEHGRGYAPPFFVVPGGGRGDYGDASFAAEHGRGYAPPYFVVPGGGRGDYGDASFAAELGRGYAPPSCLVPGGGRGDYGDASFAAELGRGYAPPSSLGAPLMPGHDGQRFAPAHGSFAGGPRGFLATPNHSVAMDADSHATGGGPFGSSINHHGRSYDTAPAAHALFGNASNPMHALLHILSDVPIQTITRQNSHTMFRRIKDSIAHRTGDLHIALDLEYVAAASTVTSRPHTLSDWYLSLKDYIDNGALVQIGLVLLFDTPITPRVHAYEINICIDTSEEEYSSNSVDFLVSHGHNLDEYKNTGVLEEWLFVDLIRRLPLNDDTVTWVTFHGDKDIGFIMKLALGGCRGLLPHNRSLFMLHAKDMFPVLYDCRVLAQLVILGFSGSLNKLAEFLDIQRTGEQHFAGSDALVTLGCFARILHQCAHNGVSARSGLMSGAEELQMSIRCSVPVNKSGMYPFNVTPLNYLVEAEKIYDLLNCNFVIIVVQVLVTEQQSASCADSTVLELDNDHEKLMEKLARVHRFDLQLCFMNEEAEVAYGRVWKFSVDMPDHTLALARLLASSGATHDPSRLWVTMHGSEAIACLLKSFLAPTPMPNSLNDYLSFRKSCFPYLLDLGLVTDRCSDVPMLTTGCKGGMSHLASSLGVAEDPCDVITILRCYECFRKRGLLHNFVPGVLMDRCCSMCTS
uniref:Uncharacterized protein n=1 Tax=Avena sativa TaxID=4498 RepID=A0ACD5TD17_AVESA